MNHHALFAVLIVTGLWIRPALAARENLTVGFLPVTCHLTCPVTDFATRTSTTTRFESMRYTDYPTMAEAIKSGRLQATFMIVPLAMKLREQGIPVKIAYLGHRDGSTVIVSKRLNAVRDLRDLRGRTIAVPSRFSNQNLVLHALMEKLGMTPEDLRFVELPPPDMPLALRTGAIDAYFVGEPHAARAELEGSGRVLHHAKDIWPGFVSCALVVHERLIQEHSEIVRDLVRGVSSSGEWAETHRTAAARLAAPYYRQDEKLLQFVLTQPPDRVSFRNLTPTDRDLNRIQSMAVKMGILKKAVPLSELLDRSFIPARISPASIEEGATAP